MHWISLVYLSVPLDGNLFPINDAALTHFLLLRVDVVTM